VWLRTASRHAAAAALVTAGAEVTEPDQDRIGVRGMAPERIAAVLSAGRVPFSELAPHRATLEEAYLDLTGGAVEYRATEPEVTP
jgi:ABC-2 type transport system ATP-binding protein